MEKIEILSQNEINLIIKESFEINSFNAGVDEALKMIVQKVTKILGVDLCSVILVNRERFGSDKIASQGLSKNFSDFLLEIFFKKKFVDDHFASKKALVVNDISKTQKLQKKIIKGFQEEGIGAFIGIPMIIDNNIIGLIMIYANKPQLFFARQIYSLSILASQAAIAIHNNFLYEKLKKEKLKLEVIQDSIEDGIIVFDAEGKILSYNKAAKKLLGFKENYYGAKRSDIISSPEEYFNYGFTIDFKIQGTFQKVLRTKKSKSCLVMIKCRKEEKFLQTLMSPIIKNEEVISVISSFRDVTSMEKQKNEIVIQRDKWEAIFKNSVDGIMVAYFDNNEILTINPSLEKMLGYEEKDIIGKNYHDILGYKTDNRGKCKNCPIKRTLKKNSSTNKHVEDLLVRRSGERFWAEFAATVIKESFNKRSMIVLTIRDITNERQIDQTKKDFISIVSHELRTPLTAVKGFLSMIIKGDVGPLEPKQLHFLNRVYQSNERMVNLVEDLLIINRLDTHKLTFKLESTDFSQVLSEVIDESTLKGLSKQIILTTNIAESLPMFVTDADRLRQVLFNLIDNAIKYSEPNTRVIITARKKLNHIKVTVADSGVGIAKDDMGKLFNKFSRISNSLSIKGGGSGLGLYITKGIIKAQGGDIWAESVPGKGTKFSFTLPINFCLLNNNNKKKEKL